MNSLIVRAAERVLTPLIVVMALYLLLRGGGAPGGGFIAGLVAGLAVLLRYYAHGRAALDRLVEAGAGDLIGLGLVLVVVTGLAGYLLGGHFLETAHTTVTLPLLGDLDLSSALAFELGVFLVVVAVVVAVVQELGSR